MNCLEVINRLTEADTSYIEQLDIVHSGTLIQKLKLVQSTRYTDILKALAQDESVNIAAIANHKLGNDVQDFEHPQLIVYATFADVKSSSRYTISDNLDTIFGLDIENIIGDIDHDYDGNNLNLTFMLNRPLNQFEWEDNGQGQIAAFPVVSLAQLRSRLGPLD
jgi:hypothetical protein